MTNHLLSILIWLPIVGGITRAVRRVNTAARDIAQGHFDVRVPDQVEQKFRELAGELAPDPLNADRLRLNRLLHQTPDLPG